MWSPLKYAAGRAPDILKQINGVSQSRHKNVWIIPQLDHECYFFSKFFSIHQPSSYHPTLYSVDTECVVKQLTLLWCCIMIALCIMLCVYSFLKLASFESGYSEPIGIKVWSLLWHLCRLVLTNFRRNESYVWDMTSMDAGRQTGTTLTFLSPALNLIHWMCKHWIKKKKKRNYKGMLNLTRT
jgi:hypothetical protein